MRSNIKIYEDLLNNINIGRLIVDALIYKMFNFLLFMFFNNQSCDSFVNNIDTFANNINTIANNIDSINDVELLNPISANMITNLSLTTPQLNNLSQIMKTNNILLRNINNAKDANTRKIAHDAYITYYRQTLIFKFLTKAQLLALYDFAKRKNLITFTTDFLEYNKGIIKYIDIAKSNNTNKNIKMTDYLKLTSVMNFNFIIKQAIMNNGLVELNMLPVIQFNFDALQQPTNGPPNGQPPIFEGQLPNGQLPNGLPTGITPAVVQPTVVQTTTGSF